MKPLFIILFILSGITQATAFDTLHNFNHQHEQDNSGHWYDPITNFFGQKKPDTQNRDIIIINKDRTITFNGHTLKLMDPVEKWIQVLGKPSRLDQYSGYSWDNNGISIATDKTKNVKTIEIQFLTHYEIFPSDKLLGKKAGQGGILADYFKGIVILEDGYLAREVTRDQFRKSDVWKKFKKDAFPNSYWFSYGEKEMYQGNVIAFTPDGKLKRFSMY